jgi:hypothetical protein
MLLLLTPVSRAFSQVSISLPEQGEYRIGQFLFVDVRVENEFRNLTIELNADGARPTYVYMRGESYARVPLLMLSGNVARLRWKSTFGTATPVAVPLTSRTAASDTLNALGGEDVYAPTVAWNPGASIRLRRPAMLASILIAIVFVISALLLNRRKAMIVIGGVAAVGIMAFETARRNIAPVWRAEGQIIVAGEDGAVQFDQWQYLTVRRASVASIELPDGAIPVFVDAQHGQVTQSSLHYDASRKILSLQCSLQPGMKVAVVHRRTMTESASPLPTTRPITRALRSPMGVLARRVYVDQGTRIVDEGSVECTS